MSSTSAATEKPKRTRVSQACNQCRRRKYKCDGIRPHCATCRKSSLECSWESTAAEKQSTQIKQKAPRVKYTELLETRVKELETIARAKSLDISSLSSLEVGSSSDASSRPPPSTQQPSTFPLTVDRNHPVPAIDPILSQSSLDELAELYFACHYHVRPDNFLHQCTFFRNLRNHSPLLLNAVYAIGATYSEQLPRFRAGDVFYTRAEQQLSQMLESLSLEIVQALLLMGGYAFLSGRTSASASHYDTAIDAAMRIGLHMEPSKNYGTEQSWIEKESMRRTFWACYLADRQLSKLGFRSQRIGNVGVNLPLPELAWSAVHTKPTDGPEPINEPVMDDPFSAFLQLYDIFDRVTAVQTSGSITNELPTWTSVSTQVSPQYLEQLPSFDHELRAWFARLPSWATSLGKYFIPDLSADRPLKAWFWVAVHMLYHTTRLVLHWPGLIGELQECQCPEIAAEGAAAQACLKEAQQIIRILKESILPTNAAVKNVDPVLFGLCAWQAVMAYISMYGVRIAGQEEVNDAVKTGLAAFAGLGTHFAPAISWGKHIEDQAGLNT